MRLSDMDPPKNVKWVLVGDCQGLESAELDFAWVEILGKSALVARKMKARGIRQKFVD
jgi:hypothetical protein